MGLFSSKYVTTVGTSVSRVIEDGSLPHAVKTGSIKALLKDEDIVDYVMEELVASLGVRAERYYKYAENSYIHGLPSGEIYSSTQGRQEVESTIEQIEGQQVALGYSHYGPLNALHAGWMKLISDYGYNPSTNELSVLSAQKAVPVYLKDMTVVIPASEEATLNKAVIAQWGTAARAGYTPERVANTGAIASMVSPSPVAISQTATDVYLRVTAVWEKPAPIGIQEESFDLSISDVEPTAGFFHAKYTVNGITKYWLYKDDSGTYPVLDAVYVEKPVVSGEYFPFVYFRYNKAPTNSDTSIEAYRDSKKLTKILGMSFDSLADSINENPDIADVEQAMLTFAVPAVSENSIECRYLFEYFDNLNYSMNETGVTSRRTFFQNITEKANTIVIKDALFKMALSNNGIFKRVVAGSIGSIGSHTTARETKTFQEPYTDQETGNMLYSSFDIAFHYYRKQIAAGIYEEIIVRDLTMHYFVFGDYTTTSDENEGILLIPLDRTISSAYSISEREILYARAMHLVFNSRVITKVKWYQQEWFRIALIIAAIIMTILSLGTDGGTWIATATGLTGTALVIVSVIINVIIIPILLKSLFKLFVKAFGQDVANIIALVALVYGAYELFNAGVAGAPFAEAMLQLSTGLRQAALGDQYKDLLEDSMQFKAFAEEQTKLLEDTKDLLSKSSVLTPFVIFGEKPESFYNRTVHMGNIGTIGIAAISHYVDTALTLPKLNDTLGETLYGKLH